MRLIFYLSLSFILAQTDTVAQIVGCTDPLASNYSSSANVNNGSCVYQTATLNGDFLAELPAAMNGSSGLIVWDNKRWTLNNFNDNKLYSFQSNTLPAYQTSLLNGYTNIDWEEIAQDEQYLYIADFGNNVSGNRRDLRIYRIIKNSILNPPLIGDTIRFSYNTQTDFTPLAANQSNFDAEAFVVTQDSLYIFTKEWGTQKTSMFRLPNQPGTHTATLQGVLDVQGLITGAVYLPAYRLVLLSGYSSLLQPFVYLLYDFKQHEFFSGNKRKLNLNLPFHQVEAITAESPLQYLITNERFSQFSITVPPRLHQLDLTSYLSSYVQSLPVNDITSSSVARLFPNPTQNEIIVEYNNNYLESYQLIDLTGIVLQSGVLKKGLNKISVFGLSPGVYYFKYGPGLRGIIKFVKQ